MKINIPDNIEQLKENKWLSITVQSFVLGLNFLLISQKIINSYSSFAPFDTGLRHIITSFTSIL